MNTEPTKLLCKRCHYEWTPKAGETPKACPRCKSYKWNVDRNVKLDSGVEESVKRLGESLKGKL